MIAITERTSKRLTGLLLGGVVMLVLIGAWWVIRPVAAQTGGANQPRNEAEARARIESLCRSGAPVAHAGYVTNPQFDEATGRVTYQLTVLWRRCRADVNTRAYAVTGYPAEAHSGFLTICPDVGIYGRDNGGKTAAQPGTPKKHGLPTHDCVKYGHKGANEPYSAIWCWQSGTFGYHGGSCTRGGFWGAAGIEEAQPSTAVARRTYTLTGQIPNWESERVKRKRHQFGARGALCAFYKPELGRGTGRFDDRGRSGQMCQDVLIGVSWKHYDLVPAVQLEREVIDTADRRVAFLASISNRDSRQSVRNARALVRFILPSGAPSQGDGEVKVGAQSNGNLYSRWFCEVIDRAGLGAGGCTDLEMTGSGDPVDGGGRFDFARRDDDLNGVVLQPGEQVCYAAVVNNYNLSATVRDLRYAYQCARVGKKPAVQVWGADVRAGVGMATTPVGRGKVVTNQARLADRIHGSWAEYGIFARDEVRSASGASLAGVGGDGGVSDFERNRLTFQNERAPFGRFGPLSASFRPGLQPGGGRVTVTLGAGTPAEIRADHVVLQGGTLPKGKQVTIQARIVEVAQSVQYTNEPLQEVAELPQLLIRARDIVVAAAVERIDGWLIADETVSTCGAVGDPGRWWQMDVAACNKQLQLNGPVFAKHLYLRRTHGAEAADPGRPAEIINARPDIYMAEYGRARRSGAIRTMHLRELPPRF